MNAHAERCRHGTAGIGQERQRLPARRLQKTEQNDGHGSEHDGMQQALPLSRVNLRCDAGKEQQVADLRQNAISAIKRAKDGNIAIGAEQRRED